MDQVLLLLLLLGLIALSLWGIVDASLQPSTTYAAAGLSKAVVTTMLILTCTLGSLVYFALLRPRLMRSVRR